jgi:dienelactone hydrolase
MADMPTRLPGLVLLIACLGAACAPTAPMLVRAAEKVEHARTASFVARRARHVTHLVTHGPAPQAYAYEDPPPGAQRVTYTSGPLVLFAWYAPPAAPMPQRRPALVYFHGGWALGREDFEAVRPFVDAGFAVMTPALRGENGNPGDFEAYYGEVDDARAAVAWLRVQPGVDPGAVFVFGHSAGGVIAALLSCYDDTGVRLAGSAGGFYDTVVLPGPAPYDASDREETELRESARQADQIRVPHLAFVGDDDWQADRGASIAVERAAAAGAPLTRLVVPGDHQRSLPAALASFLARAKEELTRR